MALTNPTPVAYQTLETLMQKKKENSEPVVEKKGLLGPKSNKMSNNKDNEMFKPMNRVASYIETARRMREEIKNGRG